MYKISNKDNDELIVKKIWYSGNEIQLPIKYKNTITMIDNLNFLVASENKIYTYDVMGNIIELKYSSGATEKYEYDEKKAIKLYAYREIDEEYTVTKVGILYASNPTLGYYTNDGKNLLEDETYKVEELLKTNKNGNVSEIVAKNPTNIGDYALIYTIVKDTDMVYALPYVEATDAAGKEYKFYGPVTAANYEQAK